MINAEIRMEANKSRVKLWQIAEHFKGGMADCNFSRKLRHELPETDKKEILNIIYELSKKG